MIKYPQANIHPLRIFQIKGSAFPFAFCVAFPCALLAVLLKVFTTTEFLEFDAAFEDILSNAAAHSGFTFLCGFLVVFRTSQAYHRMWDGVSSVESMQVAWFDCASALMACSRAATADDTLVLHFQHQLIRLLSMLHAAGLAQLESNEDGQDHAKDVEVPKAFLLELIDAQGVDKESLMAVQDSTEKVELIYQWIQSLIIDNIKNGVLAVPPPICTRSFQRLSDGFNHFHNAFKITDVPFPFPYMQATEALLMLHWVVTPMVVCSWTNSPVWAGVFVFLQTFILWALNTTACQIENPFGDDDNDLNAYEMQTRYNRRLLLLLRPAANRIPHLSKMAVFEEEKQSLLSFKDLWSELKQVERVGTAHPANNFIHPRGVCCARLNTAKQHAVDRLALLLADSDGCRSQPPSDNLVSSGDTVVTQIKTVVKATTQALSDATGAVEAEVESLLPIAFFHTTPPAPSHEPAVAQDGDRRGGSDLGGKQGPPSADRSARAATVPDGAPPSSREPTGTSFTGV